VEVLVALLPILKIPLRFMETELKQPKNNKEEMIRLCRAMVSFNQKSSSVFAKINEAIWNEKLKYWESI